MFSKMKNFIQQFRESCLLYNNIFMINILHVFVIGWSSRFVLFQKTVELVVTDFCFNNLCGSPLESHLNITHL